MKKNINNYVKRAPLRPGIYIFKNKRGEFLYIGKAVNLRNRIRQYFKYKATAPYLKYLLNEAEKIDFKITGSEIEALILEAQLIKELKPKYNIMLRDDKKYFYVGFSNDKFPRIFITHQPLSIKRGMTQLGVPHSAQTTVEHYGGGKAKVHSKRESPQEGQDPEARGYIGPFTDGAALKTTLRLLRRVFPYCTCKQKHNNFCLNYHIGKCLGICCLKQQSRNFKFSILIKKISNDYKRNIKAIKNILLGKKTSVVKNLKKELALLGKKQEFEKAIELRNKIEKLEKIFANAKIIREYEPFDIWKYQSKKAVLNVLKNIFALSRIPHRIEGYDISNIQGKNATGAMIVFTNGTPDKNEYRKFKIRWGKEPNDIAMLKEVLIRRFKHSGMLRTPKPWAKEWPSPDLIFIDGGKAQLNAAENAIAFTAAFSKNIDKNTVVISLAKGKKEVFSSTLKKPVPLKKLPKEIKNLILNIDSEAHRFAISYYRRIHRRQTFK